MSNNWEILQSKTIDALRFPMAVAVVILHHGITLMEDATGPLRICLIVFQEGLCRLAVPCFFFISGYLFFNKLQDWSWGEWKRKIKSRGRTLLVPYLLWNLIAFFAFWAFARIQGDGISLHEHFLNNGGLRLFWSTNGDIPLGLRSAPCDPPLWFIRDLMLFTLLTPLIHPFLRWTRGFGALAIAVFFLFVPGIIPEGFVFYLTGCAFQLQRKNVVETLWPRRVVFYLLSVVFLIALCILFDNEYWRRLAKNLFLFCGIAAAFCATAHLLQQDRIRVHPFLARSSFFIFAAHYILILHDFARPMVYALLPNSGAIWPCLNLFLTPLLAVGICLGLLFLMERLIPRTTALLTGNRMTKPSYS